MVPQEIIDKILEKASIVDLISKYTDVKKSGRNHMALCPFHGEKTPSFSISEEKGLYHCFGCGASGNAVRFLMDYRKLSFTEALRELAPAAGIDLSQYEDNRKPDTNRGEKDRLLALHRDAMVFCHDLLMKDTSGAQARQYLTKRKLTADTVKKYRLGWGGDGWSACCDHLRGKGYTDAEILKAGIGAQSSRQDAKAAARVFDRFRERVLFPILDRDGNCVAFGGRILDEAKSSAKYLNSPETPLFRKGHTLFSLNFAKEEIIRERSAIICEGYMDVIALSQFGIGNAVAPLGTALTADQLSVLGKYAEEVLFLFDGDEAGIKAANRALDTAAESSIKQGVVILPKKMDPYDFVMEHGADAFLNEIRNKRLEPVEFKLKFFSRGMGKNPDRTKLLLALFPWIARLPGDLKRDEALRVVASRMAVDPGLVLAEFNAFKSNDKRVGRFVEAVPDKKGDNGGSIGRVDAEFLAILIANPDRVMEAAGVVVPVMLATETAQNLFEFVLANADKSPKELLEKVEHPGLRKLAAQKAMEPILIEGYLQEVAWKVRMEYIKRQMTQNTRLLESYAADPAKAEETLRIQEETAQLFNEMKTVQEKLEAFGKMAG